MYGGGGLVIELNEVTSRSVCTITNMIFTQNTASSGQFSYMSKTSLHSYFGLGRGGGISVVFRGEATNNIVQLNRVVLDSNTAQFGGGLYLGFYDSASSNEVIIRNGQVIQNMALVEKDTLLTATKGGGVFIGLIANGPGCVLNNTVTISNGSFVSNEAQTGGGIAVNVLYDIDKCASSGNKMLIKKCTFINNEAFQGASAYLSHNSKCGQPFLDTTVCCSNFIGGHCMISLIYGYGLPCYGNVLLQSYPLTLSDIVVFNNSYSMSALSLRSSSVELLPSSQIHFNNNMAANGAALHLVECSSIVVNYHTNLSFENNSGLHQGGAIYAETCSLAKERDCVIRHKNSTLHPNDWVTIFTFNKNKASNQNNAIYIDSINSCIWPSFSSSSTVLDTFCWNGWVFEQNGYGVDCHNQLTSGPAYITGPTNYTLYPGDCVSLSDNEVYDSWGNIIMSAQSNLEVRVISGTAQKYSGRVCTSVDCTQEYANQSLLLLVHLPQFPGLLVNIRFKLCKNGTFCSGGYCTCYGSPIYTASCNKSSLLACTTCFDATCDVFSKGNEMCGSCADASYGVPFNFPHFICTKCQWYGIILVLLELILVLLMMIILSVLHINITNGSMNGFILCSQLMSLDLPVLGSTAWVPSSTINNTYFMNTKQFASVPLTVYSIWNLNFLTLVPTPFSIPNTSAADVILLQYIKATCPLLFILVTYVWIRWYNNGYRFVMYTTRPVHQLLARFWQKFKIQPSLIDTYAGLMLLSYMQFLAVSVKIFYIFYLEHFFPGPVNSLLVVLATVSLLAFVFPLMTILLFYHLKIFQRCLTCCKLNRPGLHALVDAYQGCFKNSATDGSERRYFAGLYLFFRFLYLVAVAIVTIINAYLFVFTPSYFFIYMTILPIEGCMGFLTAGIVVILRPYKKTSHNVIDFLILFFLTLIPLLSLLDTTFIAHPPFYYNNDTLNFMLFRNVIFLPLLIFLFYLIYRLIKWCCTNMTCPCKCKTVRKPSPDGASLSERTPLVTPPTTTEVALDDDYIQDDLYADRILNPGGYNEQQDSL